MSLAFKRLNYRSYLIGKPLLASHTTATTTRLRHNHNISLPSITRLQPTAKMSTSTSPTDPIIDQLKAYTTCDISNALVKLRHPTGGFLPGVTLWSPARQAGDTRIVGPAYTVRYAALADPAPKYTGPPAHYIDGVPAGAVVFVSCPPRTPNAVYGGLMTARARARGAVGTVVDGRFRDLQEQREMEFPVFGRDVGTAPPQGLLKVVGVDVPVKVASEEVDTEVRPGDYIIGDLNGVVVLPKELAAEVLPLMEKGVAADDQMMVQIRKGMGFEEASKKFRG